MTIDRALQRRSRHRRNFHALSALDSPLPAPSVADGSALPPLLPGSGLFRRARWNYVRKAFFSPFSLSLSFLLPPRPSPSALYTRPSQLTSHFPLFTLFPTPSYQRRLRRTTHRRSFPPTLYKTRLRLRGFQFFGDFLRDLCQATVRGSYKTRRFVGIMLFSAITISGAFPIIASCKKRIGRNQIR